MPIPSVEWIDIAKALAESRTDLGERHGFE
jgi:hypothetical protein